MRDLLVTCLQRCNALCAQVQEAKQALKAIQHAVDAERALEQQATAQLDALEASKSRHQEVVAQQAGLAAQLASCQSALKAQKQMLLGVQACLCLPCSSHAAACFIQHMLQWHYSIPVRRPGQVHCSDMYTI